MTTLVKPAPRRMRRRAYSGLGATLLLLATACGGGDGAGDDGDGPIKVGSILDETGPLNIYGTAMADATDLAIKDINENGGVLGRQLELVSYDAQSDNAKYTQYANQAAQRDQVAVLMGGITSASREAIRPVAARSETLYFYNEQYEGGVCDKNTFNTGVVPSQQLAALIPYAVENFGKNLYVIAADYNYGQISASWVEKYAEEAGGSVVESEFIPLESSDFGSVINSLQAAKPDVVVSLLVGGNHIAFYRQFASAGLDQSMKIVSPTFGLGNEQVVLSDEAVGITGAFPYFQEIESEPNTQFLDMWHTEYGDDYPYVTDSAATVWNGWHLWAEAVNAAGSLDRDAVIEELESGVSFDGPSGTVTLDGPSHHVVQNIAIGEANGQKGFEVLSTEESVPPAFEQEVCDLVSEPDTNEQFLP
ncbi:MAG: transporter substrate-binding protein [Nocardioidaceae bacterium]|nr:transporter substrate-binding protein [Nocardioidaceae bacterium]